MALQCNLDARGKAARLRGGIVALILAGLVSLATIVFSGGVLFWIIAAALAVGGGFMIFEGRMGWCALRAMGVKTRI